MSWLYMPAAAADFSAGGSSDVEQSATSSEMHTQSKLSRRASETVILMTPPSGMTSRPSTGNLGLDMWLSSLAAFPASPTAARANVLEKTTPVTSGLTPSASFAQYDPTGACWRTSQLSFLSPTSEPFSETWPRAGLVFDGTAYPRRPLARRTKGTGSGLLPTPTAEEWGSNTHMRSQGTTKRERIMNWPTPRVIDSEQRGNPTGMKGSLASEINRRSIWPTPRTQGMCGGTGSFEQMLELQEQGVITDQERKGMTAGNGGTLNPPWVEWLMGWPIGWTDLEPLATDKYRQWLQQHGICSAPDCVTVENENV